MLAWLHVNKIRGRKRIPQQDDVICTCLLYTSGTKYAILNMKENGERCSIVNRSSIDGQIAEPGLFAYCASKGAVTILTKSAALACGAKGYQIRINSVHPGYVHTALTLSLIHI